MVALAPARAAQSSPVLESRCRGTSSRPPWALEAGHRLENRLAEHTRATAVTRGPRFQAKNSCGQCHGGVQPRTVTPGWWPEEQRAAVQPGPCGDQQCGCSGCQFGGFPGTPSQKEAHPQGSKSSAGTTSCS